jgi:hypothetical protein
MATRSVVARQLENGELEGRYVHWDGYPTHMMGVLSEFIRRDGYETTCRVLLDEHNGWSFLSPFQQEDDDTFGNHIEIKEYWGKYYTDTPNEPFIKTFEEAIECYAEYIYVIVAKENDPVEIHCYSLDYGTVEPKIIEKVLCNHEYDSYCANCGVDA